MEHKATATLIEGHSLPQGQAGPSPQIDGISNGYHGIEPVVAAPQLEQNEDFPSSSGGAPPGAELIQQGHGG
jgi:hypothetical protein